MPQKRMILLALLMIVPVTGLWSPAHADSALGPRFGLSGGNDDFFLGVQGEFGPILGAATLVPSLDFTLGDHSSTALNADLRFYLFPLPETGIRFYGAAGTISNTAGASATFPTTRSA